MLILHLYLVHFNYDFTLTSLITLTAAIMSFISFLDQMPQKLKTEFLEEFKNEYMKRKLIFKRLQNNKEQTIILDIYKDLVIYAEK